MLYGNRCEECQEVVTGPRSKHPQTRYCIPCAEIMKRRNTLDPWTSDERREYMREYMRHYRRSRKGVE